MSGEASGMVDMMTSHFPSSRDATAHKVQQLGASGRSGLICVS